MDRLQKKKIKTSDHAKLSRIKGNGNFSKSGDGNVKLVQPLGEELAVSSKIVVLYIPYDTAIPLPGIGSRKFWHTSTRTDVQHWSLQ